jgi:hypothetical protein
MRFGRSMVVRCAALAASGALAVAVTAPAAGATTLKLKGGTTTLTFGTPAAQALAGMGIAIAPSAPATAAGPVLSFPISSGTLKLTGRGKKQVSGTITHAGGMSLSNATLAIGLTKPVVKLAGKQSTLNANAALGPTPPLVIEMATLDVSKATTSVTAKRVRIAGARVKLTELAATTMNAGFSVTGFTPGFEIGTATVVANVKR